MKGKRYDKEIGTHKLIKPIFNYKIYGLICKSSIYRITSISNCNIISMFILKYICVWLLDKHRGRFTNYYQVHNFKVYWQGLAIGLYKFLSYYQYKIWFDFVLWVLKWMHISCSVLKDKPVLDK